METTGARGAPCSAGSRHRPGRAEFFLRERGRGAPQAAGAPNPVKVRASGSRGIALQDQSADGAPAPPAGENPEDCESWVREKVLFLLHPERWLGTPADLVREEVAGGDDLPPEDGDDAGLNCSRKRRVSSNYLDPRSGARRGDPTTPPGSVLVRVVDYQVTEEVQQTEWTKGCMTTRTEERSMTAVTFRTNRM
ncbi:PREDICTED: uncharacterized protein C6orf141 homolog [Elephantulus edwardii]|uniref:uncharacterized protein C6orf141 homolog n=1 Tax=Elephantulus edwardii TaxID=28737 RepID=UPI0003F063B1|nr:PREDICTED: uncharacterized protein C6orf141 homolog [Elephantulus edwardii]